MRVNMVRTVENFKIAAYGESAVLWGYNHFKSNALFSFSLTANIWAHRGRITQVHVICGWGVARTIFDVVNARSRADQRCRSGQDVPTLEMFGRVSTPWARLCYGKQWLTRKLTGFKKKYVIKSIRKLMDTHRSDSFKIDPLSYGGPAWWTLSELPSIS